VLYVLVLTWIVYWKIYSLLFNHILYSFGSNHHFCLCQSLGPLHRKFQVTLIFKPCAAVFSSIPELHGLPERRLSQFPTIIYHSDMNATPTTTENSGRFWTWFRNLFATGVMGSFQVHSESCAICMEDWKAGDELKQLPCKHEFHKDCIQYWLQENYRW
jgi:hypothetical protein